MVPPAPQEGRPLGRLAALAAVAASIAVLAGGIDLASRPTLGPDVDVQAREPYIWSGRPRFDLESGCAIHDGSSEERTYDVNAALRSDEPMGPDVEPEGEGPARRRYVRPDPAGWPYDAVRGRTTLVSAPRE